MSQMSQSVRSGEQHRTYFRTERIFMSNGEWYFAIRDGAPRGPYNTKKEAEVELMLFLRSFLTADQITLN